MPTDKVSTKLCGFDYFIRTTPAVGEFSNFPGGGITSNLDTGHDKIANRICHRRAGFVGAFAVRSPAFFGEKT